MSTRRRCEAVSTLFKRLDLNGDGFINEDDFKQALQGIDAAWINDRLIASFLGADTNADGQVDLEDFAAWAFADDSDQEALCQALGVDRGFAVDTHTSAVLGVPHGMHSSNLVICDGGFEIRRCSERCGDNVCQGVFLSSPLPSNSSHALRISFEADSEALNQLYLGICRNERGRFDCLGVLSFVPLASSDNWDDFPATRHYVGADVARVFAEGGITLCVDMRAGRLFMMDRFGLEVGYWMVSGLNGMDVVFAASIDKGDVTLKLEVPRFVVNIIGEVLDSGTRLTFTSMGGELLKVLDTEAAESQTWGEVQAMLKEAISKYHGFRLAYVCPDGTMITESHVDIPLKSLPQLFS